MIIVLVFAFYLFITMLHCSFVGISVYAIGGKKMLDRKLLVPFIVCTVLLATIETYWIPVVSACNVSMITDNNIINLFFNIQPGANLLELISPGWFSFIMWPLQGLLANFIGKKIISRLALSFNGNN